jgi:3,4-dihydroxy 2-butanone 4-phosphate synthase/GTP cyclohydrolase II
VVGDLFSSTPVDGGSNLREAIAAIEKAGAGVVLYIPPKGDLVRELDAITGSSPAADGKRSEGGGHPWTLREFGLGAQVLADLGVQQLRLLTNSQLKIAGLTGFGLKVVESVALVSMNGEGW